MKIFIIGGSGLVGTRLVELLGKEGHRLDDLSLANGVDITDPSSLEIIRNDKEHEAVLHLAAKADVDGCEQDKPLGEYGMAFRINVIGTKNVVAACQVSKKKLLSISTDFVFDGKKKPPAKYSEDDRPDPINWYAETKYKGEEIVRNSGLNYAILRIAYPYRADAFALKKDFVHAIMGRLAQNKSVAAITDHIMTPTYIDDIAYAIDAVIAHDATGIFHAVGSQGLSPYDASILMAEQFGFDKSLITKTTRAEYFKGKAHRPFNLALNNGKISELGVRMRMFEEGLKELKT
jgi:dTDP-4-dehydrorhamnose reductase